MHTSLTQVKARIVGQSEESLRSHRVGQSRDSWPVSCRHERTVAAHTWGVKAGIVGQAEAEMRGHMGVKAGIVGQAEAAMRVKWPLAHGGKAIIVGSGCSHRKFTSK